MCTPAHAGTRSAGGRLEPMARLSQGISRHSAQLLDVLLATCACPGPGSPALGPIWADEAMNRAYGLLRLVAARKHQDRASGNNPVAAQIERALAEDLAMQFWALAVEDTGQILPCSRILRDVLSDLNELFGMTAGDVTLRTDLEPVSLSACKRRALVLAATELVINALLHAFQGRSGGLIEVTLRRLRTDAICLCVTDDGIGFADGLPKLDCGSAGGLAQILDADLTYHRADGRTTAMIAFASSWTPLQGGSVRCGCGSAWNPGSDSISVQVG
ncbi:MAG: hypothetical protein P4L40_13205 [Terracidiphilus sp.]|nr:hypothetical protein [Terracidiphilus sp.]